MEDERLAAVREALKATAGVAFSSAS